MGNENEKQWTIISRKSRVNDKALGPWESAGVDDNVIVEFLKRRFLKESMSVIVFEILAAITCIIGIFVFLMLGDDIYIVAVIAVLAVILLCSLFDNIRERMVRKVIIENKDYQLCDCEAYEVSEKDDEKECFIRDTNGVEFVEQSVNGEIKPMAVKYYHYFSGKDFTGKLLRVRAGQKGMLYMFFPVNYLKK